MDNESTKDDFPWNEPPEEKAPEEKAPKERLPWEEPPKEEAEKAGPAWSDKPEAGASGGSYPWDEPADEAGAAPGPTEGGPSEEQYPWDQPAREDPPSEGAPGDLHSIGGPSEDTKPWDERPAGEPSNDTKPWEERPASSAPAEGLPWSETPSDKLPKDIPQRKPDNKRKGKKKKAAGKRGKPGKSGKPPSRLKAILTSAWALKIYYFLFIWFFVGMFFGSLTLNGPMRLAEDLITAQGTENIVVILIMSTYVVATLVLSFFLVRWTTHGKTPVRRWGLAGLVIFLGCFSMYLFYTIGKSDAPSEINKRFTVGPYPDLGDMKKLKEDGYTHIISLLNPLIVAELPPLEKEKKNASRVGLELISIPMFPWISKNEEALAKIEEIAKNGNGKYYVHCFLGKDRVNLARKIIAAYAPEGGDIGGGFGRRLDDMGKIPERGLIVKLEEGVYLSPCPDDESLSRIAGNVNTIISLLDSSNRAESKMIENERTQLEMLKVNFIVHSISSDREKYDPFAVLKAARETRASKKPVLIHPFKNPSFRFEAFLIAYRSNLPPLPPTLFSDPMLGGPVAVIAPNIAVGATPEATMFEGYLTKRGVRNFIYLGLSEDSAARRDERACADAGLDWRVLAADSTELLELLKTGGPYYLYGPGLNSVRGKLEEDFGPAIPEEIKLAPDTSGLNGDVKPVAEGPVFTFGKYPDADRITELKENGFDAIISLLHPQAVVAEKELLEKERTAATNADLKLIEIPMVPKAEGNDAAFAKLRELVAQGKALYYVHCYLGADRVALAVKILQGEPGVTVNYRDGLDTRRKLQDFSDFERGELTKLADDVWLTPFPTDEEIGVLAAQFRTVVSLLDENDEGDAGWVQKEREVFAKYNVAFKLIPISTDNYDPYAVLDAARQVALFEKPIVIHTFKTPSRRSEAFIQAFWSDKPPLPPSNFSSSMSSGGVTPIAPNIIIGPRPAAEDFGGYLKPKGIRRIIYHGEATADEAIADAEIAAKAGLKYDAIKLLKDLASTLGADEPFYLYGPGLISPTKTYLSDVFGPAMPKKMSYEMK